MYINKTIRNHLKVTIVLLFLIGPPVFSWAQAEEFKVPKTPEEIKSFLGKIIELLPQAIKQSWQKALEFYQKMFQKIKEVLDRILGEKPKKIISFLKAEVRKRKSIFIEELIKENRELKQNISKSSTQCLISAI